MVWGLRDGVGLLAVVISARAVAVRCPMKAVASDICSSSIFPPVVFITLLLGLASKYHRAPSEFGPEVNVTRLHLQSPSAAVALGFLNVVQSSRILAPWCERHGLFLLTQQRMATPFTVTHKLNTLSAPLLSSLPRSSPPYTHSSPHVVQLPPLHHTSTATARLTSRLLSHAWCLHRCHNHPL